MKKIIQEIRKSGRSRSVTRAESLYSVSRKGVVVWSISPGKGKPRESRSMHGQVIVDASVCQTQEDSRRPGCSSQSTREHPVLIIPIGPNFQDSGAHGQRIAQPTTI